MGGPSFLSPSSLSLCAIFRFLFFKLSFSCFMFYTFSYKLYFWEELKNSINLLYLFSFIFLLVSPIFCRSSFFAAVFIFNSDAGFLYCLFHILILLAILFAKSYQYLPPPCVFFSHSSHLPTHCWICILINFFGTGTWGKPNFVQNLKIPFTSIGWLFFGYLTKNVFEKVNFHFWCNYVCGVLSFLRISTTHTIQRAPSHCVLCVHEKVLQWAVLIHFSPL